LSKKIFGTSLFGFKKKDVLAYLDNVTNDMSIKIKEKDNEIASLKEQISTLNSDIIKLQQNGNLFEAERQNVANAIIRAEEKAAQIIEDAKKEAQASREEILNQINSDRLQLKELQQEISHIRRNAINSISKLNGELEHLEDK